MRRMREMAHHFTLRLVLLLVDSDEAEKPLVELTRQTLSQDFTLVCAWSVAEAARYLETFKAYARKPADLIKERSDGAFSTQLADVLTTVRPLNKTVRRVHPPRPLRLAPPAAARVARGARALPRPRRAQGAAAARGRPRALRPEPREGGGEGGGGGGGAGGGASGGGGGGRWRGLEFTAHR